MNKINDLAGKVFMNRYLVGGFVLVIVAITLTLDVMGLVHPCPYCRTERAALGILSLILLLKGERALFWRFAAALAGVYGLIVGVMQNFNHVKKINKGEFDWAALTFDHPWILSGLAVTALVWLLFLILGLAKPFGGKSPLENRA
jgi:disulfide bond formation protein DsbB